MTLIILAKEVQTLCAHTTSPTPISFVCNQLVVKDTGGKPNTHGSKREKAKIPKIKWTHSKLLILTQVDWKCSHCLSSAPKWSYLQSPQTQYSIKLVNKNKNGIGMNNTENIPTRWWRPALSGKQIFPSLTIHSGISKWCFTGLLCAKRWLNINFFPETCKKISFSTRKLLRNKPRKRHVQERRQISSLLVLCGVWESRGGATTSSHKDRHRQQIDQILLTS